MTASSRASPPSTVLDPRRRTLQALLGYLDAGAASARLRAADRGGLPAATSRRLAGPGWLPDRAPRARCGRQSQLSPPSRGRPGRPTTRRRAGLAVAGRATAARSGRVARVVSERQMRSQDGRLVPDAPTPTSARGAAAGRRAARRRAPALPRPLLETGGGHRVAVELELTEDPRGAGRRSWAATRSSRGSTRSLYLVETPAAARAIERAAAASTGSRTWSTSSARLRPGSGVGSAGRRPAERPRARRGREPREAGTPAAAPAATGVWPLRRRPRRHPYWSSRRAVLLSIAAAVAPCSRSWPWSHGARLARPAPRPRGRRPHAAAPRDTSGSAPTRRAAGRACSERQLAAHGLILGASGAGKSTTLLGILGDQIPAGAPVVAIDLKGSPAFAARPAGARGAAAGRPLRVWTPDGPRTGTRSPTATPPSSRTS